MKPRLSSAATNSSEDEYLTPAPPPLPTARRFDITLSQLLTCTMDELAHRYQLVLSSSKDQVYYSREYCFLFYFCQCPRFYLRWQHCRLPISPPHHRHPSSPRTKLGQRDSTCHRCALPSVLPSSIDNSC